MESKIKKYKENGRAGTDALEKQLAALRLERQQDAEAFDKERDDFTEALNKLNTAKDDAEERANALHTGFKNTLPKLAELTLLVK